MQYSKAWQLMNHPSITHTHTHTHTHVHTYFIESGKYTTVCAYDPNLVKRRKNHTHFKSLGKCINSVRKINSRLSQNKREWGFGVF